MSELFPHNEYHIYTMAGGLDLHNLQHIHLTMNELAQAEFLHTFVHSSDISTDWEHIHRLDVGDNVYLTVGDAWGTPALKEPGYEGWEPCDDGDFEKPVFFDSMIFYKSSWKYEYEEPWDIADVMRRINSEHRQQFEDELNEYVDGSDRRL